VHRWPVSKLILKGLHAHGALTLEEARGIITHLLLRPNSRSYPCTSLLLVALSLHALVLNEHLPLAINNVTLVEQHRDERQIAVGLESEVNEIVTWVRHRLGRRGLWDRHRLKERGLRRRRPRSPCGDEAAVALDWQARIAT